MLLAGVGFLLPYNSFITDVDYLHHKFPGGFPTVPSAIKGCPAHSALAATLQKPCRQELTRESYFIQILAQL